MENQTSDQDTSKKLGQIAAKAWSDPAFKKRLLTEPAAIAQEYGMPLPPGMELRIVEDTAKVRHFVLPPKPNGEELSDEQLDQVAGGGICTGTYASLQTVCTISSNCSGAPSVDPTCGSCW